MKVDLATAREHGLTEAEYAQIVDRLGRTPTWVELGIISVMWSEHCSYKSSRRHLKGLPTTAPWVLQGPGENAGIIDVGDGLAACFKIESHNHPSFIEPYQGATTGVGGIMRDVFTMGARPVANMNSLRFGRLDAPRMRFLVDGVVAGIGGYGNCMGVPTVGGEVAFDPSYDGNILVNAFCLGVMRSDRIFRSAAAGVGNAVIYVGSKTGRDGIHGATMASEEFGAESDAKRPRVQVGDPFTEKKLLEACLELMKDDVIIAIQDMGAAGLTCSTCEMAAKGGLGIEVDVAKVPRRETGMTAYEVMLSESQERMLMVVKEGGEPRVRQVFEKWDLDVAVVGHLTDSGRIVIKDGLETVADLPADLPVDGAPIYDRPARAPADLEARWTQGDMSPGRIEQRLLALLAQPTIASKRWVYEQYDWSVRASTVRGPGSADAAVIRLPDASLEPTSTTRRGVAMTVDVNARLVYLDPRRGTKLAVLEAARNLACVGAEAKAVSDCLNFGNPEKPEVMWSLIESIQGLSEACSALNTPVISGNVSLYNETEGRAILPTPTVAMVGVVEDVERSPGMGFRAVGDKIALLGFLEGVSFAGSELALMETGQLQGRPDDPNFTLATAVHSACIQAVREGMIASAHDVSEGGLLVALAECCIRSRDATGRGLIELGAKIALPSHLEPVRAAFGEGPSLIIVSVKEENVEDFSRIAREHGAPLTWLGEVQPTSLQVDNALDLPVSALSAVYETAFAQALASEARSEVKPSGAGRPDLLRPGTGGLASEARSEVKPSGGGRPDSIGPGTAIEGSGA